MTGARGAEAGQSTGMRGRDEEEQDLEEQEAVDSANNAILAAKARSRGARVRPELDDRRFEVAAARSESLARIEDEIANDMGSAVDSANLTRDLGVDTERVLSDRTDAHMNDLVSGCGYSENANHDFVAEVPAQAYMRVVHNARFSSADKSGDKSWNITTCRDIPSDMLIDLTSDNARVCTTESSFGKFYQRPSN
jgi:hypothetical protein